GTPVATQFTGTPVEFTITTGTVATFVNNGQRTLTTNINSSGLASAGLVSMNGETEVVFIEVKSTFAGRDATLYCRVTPTDGAVTLETVLPTPADGLFVADDVGQTVPGVRVRTIDADGNPVQNATIRFRLHDAHGGGEARFVGTPDPKSIDVTTDPSGEATSPDMDLVGTYGFAEELEVETDNPAIGTLTLAYAIIGRKEVHSTNPPVPLQLEPIGVDQELNAGDRFAPVGVRVTNALNGEPVAGVYVRLRTASVNVGAAAPPIPPEGYYLEDVLSARGPQTPAGTIYLPTHQFGTVKSLNVSSPAPEGRFGHRGVTLTDGKLLFVGGRNGPGGQLASSFVVD
ncbi:MAG: hypothetical protein KJ070_26875, partial [Verrucomicrobia bacterium]|nr:hypothetical protein [Verrucomicrobiota bacterium]